MTLRSTVCNPTTEKAIRRAARQAGIVTTRNASTSYEHGQWWIENARTGAQYAVEDAEGPGSFEGFCFEQVTVGDPK